MQPFTPLSGTAAALPEENVDTDIIFPARFLLITDRHGLGRYAFHDRRFGTQGEEIASFVLNGPPGRDASILIAGANFGSGSSREQAVWALLGQGIRCVVAPSFGDIFYGNCFRNGVLPIVLDLATITCLSAAAQDGQRFIIDLDTQTIHVGDAPPLAFEIAAQHRLALLNGWDETDMILNARGDDIAAFEDRHQRIQPWLFETEEPS